MAAIDTNQLTALQPAYRGTSSYLVAIHDNGQIAIEHCPAPAHRGIEHDAAADSFTRQVLAFHDGHRGARVTLGFGASGTIETADSDDDPTPTWPGVDGRRILAGPRARDDGPPRAGQSQHGAALPARRAPSRSHPRRPPGTAHHGRCRRRRTPDHAGRARRSPQDPRPPQRPAIAAEPGGLKRSDQQHAAGADSHHGPQQKQPGPTAERHQPATPATTAPTAMLPATPRRGREFFFDEHDPPPPRLRARGRGRTPRSFI